MTIWDHQSELYDLVEPGNDNDLSTRSHAEMFDSLDRPLGDLNGFDNCR